MANISNIQQDYGYQNLALAVIKGLTEENMSRGQVINELVEIGYYPDDATAFVDNVIEGYKDVFRNNIWTGLAWAGGGVLLTVLTGGVFIFYGAVIWGVWQMIRGAYNGYLKEF